MLSPVLTPTEQLMEDVTFLEGKMGAFISDFNKQRKKGYKDCEDFVFYYSGRPHRKNVIRRLCEESYKWQTIFFTPLLNWLEKYNLNRQGRLAFTTKSLDNFLRRGIVIIHNFVVLTSYFADHYNIYLDGNKDLAEFIYRLNQKLIGCGLDPDFPFLALSETVQPLVEDLEDMRDYLYGHCLTSRAEILKM